MAGGTQRGSAGKLIVLLGLVAVCLGVVIGYQTCSKPAGLLGRYDCHYAVIDLKAGYRVKPALARTGKSETFRDLANRLKPYAMITGTYYDENRRPLGDIVIDGKIACRGCQRQGVGFTRSGQIRFLERKGRNRINWSGCDAGVACGPRLIRSGKTDINVQRDGFTSRAATIQATRCAIGATREGKLVLLAVNDYVTLSELAGLMQELGAVDAINLDGGALTGFYLNGRLEAEPISPVSNVIAVYRKK